MKIETLEQKIALRADANVQARIAKFKLAIDNALKDLLGTEDCASYSFGEYHHSESGGNAKSSHIEGARRKLQVLKLAIQSYDNVERSNAKKYRPWPTYLWEVERQAIRDDLMSKMDTLQKLLMTPERTGDSDVVPDSTVAGTEE